MVELSRNVLRTQKQATFIQNVMAPTQRESYKWWTEHLNIPDLDKRKYWRALLVGTKEYGMAGGDYGHSSIDNAIDGLEKKRWPIRNPEAVRLATGKIGRKPNEFQRQFFLKELKRIRDEIRTMPAQTAINSKDILIIDNVINP